MRENSIIMKKFVFAFAFAAMMLVCGCGKESSGDNSGGGDTDRPSDKNWASLVDKYPFLEGFPVFDGEVENCRYSELGSDMKTMTFFDYKCAEDVATTYYAKFIPAGFTKAGEGSEIYRKTADGFIYTFTGGYSAGNFALSFSVEAK